MYHVRHRNSPCPAVWPDTFARVFVSCVLVSYRPALAVAGVFLLHAPCLAQLETPAVDPRERPAQVVEELQRLKQQMGGGVAESLKDLFDDPQVGRETLRRDYENQLRALATESAVGQPPATSAARRAPQSRQRIRDAARQLDQVSADLEDLELYGVADQLRHQASALRQLARQAGRPPARGARLVSPSAQPRPVAPSLRPNSADLPRVNRPVSPPAAANPEKPSRPVTP